MFPPRQPTGLGHKPETENKTTASSAPEEEVEEGENDEWSLSTWSSVVNGWLWPNCLPSTEVKWLDLLPDQRLPPLHELIKGRSDNQMASRLSSVTSPSQQSVASYLWCCHPTTQTQCVCVCVCACVYQCISVNLSASRHNIYLLRGASKDGAFSVIKLYNSNICWWWW